MLDKIECERSKGRDGAAIRTKRRGDATAYDRTSQGKGSKLNVCEIVHVKRLVAPPNR